MRKKLSWYGIAAQVALILVFLSVLFIFFRSRTTKDATTVGENATEQVSTSKVSAADLPDVSTNDWELILVNRDNITEELDLELATVDNIQVDARIEENVINFLAAAQEVDPSEHLISGYRSVAYQEEIYNMYIQQEMAEKGLDEAEAEKEVQTYSQPPGASEHQTGLAIDMSTVDSLNESDEATVAQLKKIAPEYGFVLRFEEDKHDSTGINYEDWHFRYVGIESAKFMTENNLSLEEYVALLKENGK